MPSATLCTSALDTCAFQVFDSHGETPLKTPSPGRGTTRGLSLPRLRPHLFGVVGQFDCGGREGWQAGDSGRIFQL